VCRAEWAGGDVSSKEIPYTGYQCIGKIMMESRIEACRVTERFLVPMSLGFDQQECFFSLTDIAECLSADEHTAFERHVKSGKLSIAVALHATQIVNAQFAFPD